MLKVLTLSSLYPSAARPRHGIFVETRLRHLVASGRVVAKVVCPVPWFPLKHAAFGEYGRQARTPLRATRHGIDVEYPRYLMIPKVGMALQPHTMAAVLRPVLQQIRRSGFDFDLIDANYFYPDGIAAATLAREIGVPFTVTARGSDINVIANLRGPRRAILKAAAEARALIAVSGALRTRMVELGIEASKVTVVRNGVDLELFKPVPQQEARQQLGVTWPRLVASVGNLVTGKGHDRVLHTVAGIASAGVVIVGRGPEAPRLRTLAKELRMDDRVLWLDEMSQDRLRVVYSAADVLALFSMREGWPNVVLEALACGTPVAAFDVGGVEEMLTDTRAGVVIRDRSDESLRQALVSTLAIDGNRDDRRSHAAAFGWDDVVERQLRVFDEAVAGVRAPSVASSAVLN
jgi:glycosyltransferase involved in cell wall biosynthesis